MFKKKLTMLIGAVAIAGAAFAISGMNQTTTKADCSEKAGVVTASTTGDAKACPMKTGNVIAASTTGAEGKKDCAGGKCDKSNKVNKTVL